ncbi:reverse transcriptase domain-containing protein [Curtobacterium sp. MCSS17_016]|uniref:reverse transcriptase domain-containing protein n=1 Tax=Curtobacterium sp. MCSS17_016 TaxID=2175644 RepID=UPI0015E899E6|nr:reverse transcriptase domain-containing protein [Curtobacterium sp. MCSS17_016]WIE80067.1 reverse transcriptase domain-containing protein [Curtobacterium sp. MCSS17_016]
MKISAADLLAESDKLIRKHQRYMRQMRIDDERRRRRGSVPARATLLRPTYWSVDRGFDPYHVRKNASAIARAINLALKAGSYSPKSPVAHSIAKPSGGERELSIFQIADSVVSRAIYRSLLVKNRALLSARSYAYRDDLSTHDAIQYIASEFATDERIFIAEYDFSAYFDSIGHSYVLSTLEDNGFLITAAELRVLKAFMGLGAKLEGSYNDPAISGERTVGIPQGTSVSLFLANVAAWRTDRELERIGVGFARYADDTLIWSRDYQQITSAVNFVKAEAASIGATLNKKKSQGIRLFVEQGENTEIRSTSEVEFVGYRFKRGTIGLKQPVVERMKTRVRYLIWSNLLEPLQSGTGTSDRVRPPVDRDYVVTLLQIRRYLYGNFSEAKLRELERGAARRIRFPGVLAYFPLASDLDQLKDFDGWLLSTLEQALRKRAMLLGRSNSALPVPFGLRGQALASAWGETSAGDPIDLRVPSVARFMSVLRRAATVYGANFVSRGTGAEEYQYSFSSSEEN